MEGTLQQLQIQYEEKSLKVAELAKKAAKMAHTIFTAEKKSQNAYKAISSHDKSIMWNTLQKYLQEYADFINKTSRFTGLCVYRVDSEFYNRVTIIDMEKQLRIIVGYIYARDAVRSTAKTVYKECLKKLLKESGIFTDAELALL